MSAHRLIARTGWVFIAWFFWSEVLVGIATAQVEMVTRRPVIHGKHYAVASMKPLASLVAERILHSGGNAFDAAVAAQAVLSQVDASNNGIGSDAVLLVYDSRLRKVFSVNAEGTA
ncbi:MAG: gamma-glutamyltransferase, partial [Acidobacteriota bacterium]